MNYATFKGLTWLYSGLLPLVITLLALIIIAYINASKLRLAIMSWRKHRLLNSIGNQQKRNLIFYDKLDGNFKVDRLILLKDSILLISLKQYSGNIYCSEKIAEWTQSPRESHQNRRAFYAGTSDMEPEDYLSGGPGASRILGHSPKVPTARVRALQRDSP